jgi:hypothetical protein
MGRRRPDRISASMRRFCIRTGLGPRGVHAEPMAGDVCGSIPAVVPVDWPNIADTFRPTPWTQLGVAKVYFCLDVCCLLEVVTNLMPAASCMYKIRLSTPPSRSSRMSS